MHYSKLLMILDWKLLLSSPFTHSKLQISAVMKLIVFSFLLVLQIASHVRDVSAFSVGAPTAACGDLTQQHPGVTPLTCGPSCPFTVSLVAIDGSTPTSPNTYRCGSQHTCKQSPINDSIVSIQTILWRIIDKFACVHTCLSVHDIVWLITINSIKI